MKVPAAFDPNTWYGNTKPKTKPLEDQTVSETASDGMKTIGKVALGGLVATMALGMAKGFSNMFQK